MDTFDGLSAERKRLAIKLLEVGAFKDKSKSPDGRGFRLKLHEMNPEAPLSPFFVDLRTSDNPKPGEHYLTREIVNGLGTELYRLANRHGIQYECVVGVPNAGDPFAKAFAVAAAFDQRFVCQLQLAKTVQADKRRVTSLVGQPPTRGTQVLLIDDLITKAASKLEAITVLRGNHLVVMDVLVVLNREQGGKEELERLGCRLHSLFTLSALLHLYRSNGLLDEAIYNEIHNYILLDK